MAHSFIIYGALAQLGERLLCTQEVSGSIPLGSIKKDFKLIGLKSFFILGRFRIVCCFCKSPTATFTPNTGFRGAYGVYSAFLSEMERCSGLQSIVVS